MTDTRYRKVTEINEAHSVPPKDPPDLVVQPGGRSSWRITIPAVVVAALIGFAGSLLARPTIDTSRMESKIDALDSKVGTLSESVTRDIAALRERQATDSNAFTTGINRTSDKLDWHIERESDRVAAIERHLEAMGRHQ